MPKTVEMNVIFLVEDEEKLLQSFDPIRSEEVPRTLEGAASALTQIKGPPGTTVLRTLYRAKDSAKLTDVASYCLRTNETCAITPREETGTVKVVKVTTALVIEDEELLYRVADWTLNRASDDEHNYELVSASGQIDVTECVMALFASELPPGVRSPIDSFEMKEFPAEQARWPGFDFIKSFGEGK